MANNFQIQPAVFGKKIFKVFILVALGTMELLSLNEDHQRIIL